MSSKMRRVVSAAIVVAAAAVLAAAAYVVVARRVPVGPGSWLSAWMADARYRYTYQGPPEPRGVEGMWLGYHKNLRDPDSIHAQFRVLKVGYTRFDRMTHLVVHWQVRNLQSKPAEFCDTAMLLHRHPEQIVVSQSDPRNIDACETVAAGHTSNVLTAFYTFVADRPNDAHTLEWGLAKTGGSNPIPELAFHIRLSPQQVDSAQLFEPALVESVVYRTAHAPDGTPTDTAPVGFSVLESAGEAGCGWSQQPWEGTAKRLAVVPGLCNQLTVALSGDTEDALLSNYGVTVLSRGKKGFIPGPGQYGFAIFDDAGSIVGFRRDDSPAAYRRYSKLIWENNAWRFQEEMSGVPDDCGAAYLRNNTFGQVFNCRVLHTAWHPYVCEPVGLTADACARPDPQPVDSDVETQLAHLQPTAGNWLRFGTASADVIMQMGASSYSLDHLELNAPVYISNSDGLIGPPELASGSVFLVAFSGPYCLLGVQSVPRLEEGRGVIKSRLFRVYDLRSGQLERTFPESVEAVQFWPASNGRSSVAARVVATSPHALPPAP